MKEAFLKNLQEKAYISPGDKIVAGFSGGADSTALTFMLQELKEVLKADIIAVHVHHGIRKDTADRDEAFCRSFCEERGIPYKAYFVDAPKKAREEGLSLEEAGRLLRYDAFFDAASFFKANVLALAHHKDDQAETVLFQLVRGSGLRGLSGMQEVSERQMASGDSAGPKSSGETLRVIRPLLPFSKAQILAFLRSENLSWCEDETNQEDSASRNLIRHRVLPALTEIRPDAKEKIAEAASYLAEADTYLRKEAESWLNNQGSLNKQAVASLDPFFRSYVMAEAFRRAGLSLKDVTREHLKQAGELALKPAGKELHLPGSALIRTTHDTLEVVSKPPAGKVSNPPAGKAPNPTAGKVSNPTAGRMPNPPTGNMPGASDPPPQDGFCGHYIICTVRENNFAEKIPNYPYTKWLDCAKISEPLKLRGREEGDVIAVLPGKKKSLHRYFIDEKVPRHLRDSVPLVCMGHEVLWIVGYRISEDFKVRPETKKVLEIRIETETGDYSDER